MNSRVLNLWYICAALTSLAVLCGEPSLAQSASCNRAKAIVEEIRQMPSASDTDHRHRLARLAVAEGLCPSLGEIARLAYCSNQALRLEAKAAMYRKRAVLNGVKNLACGPKSSAKQKQPEVALGPVHQKFALVIGISKFVDPAIPSLRFSAKDAEDFARFLVQRGRFAPDNVYLLTNQLATKRNILERLNQIILRAKPDDLVVLYLSSHGSPHRPDTGLSGIGYLVSHDTSLDSIWIDGIEYEDFADKASLIKARRTVTFLDTCYSGQSLPTGAKQLVLEGVGLDERTAEMFLSGEGDYVITSSRSDEQSWESETLRNSYFTYYLIQALSQDQGLSTIREAFGRLSDQVSKAVAEDKGVGQHPQMHPMDGPGDLKLGVEPVSAIVP